MDKKLFGHYKSVLNKFLAQWRNEAHKRGFKWFPPGLGNGLMAEFLGEALELGAITLNRPDGNLDAKGQEKAKDFADWLAASSVDGFPINATFDGDVMTVWIGNAVPNCYKIKISDISVVDK